MGQPVNYDSVTTAGPQTTSCISFSDAEIKKFLCDQGFPARTATTTTASVLTAEIATVEPPNADLRSRALQNEDNRGKMILALCVIAMCVGFILAVTGQFDILAVWMIPMIMIQSVSFGMGCLCWMAEYNLKHIITQLVDDDGCAVVLQTVSKRFRRLLSMCTTYHLLVQYRVGNKRYLKILHVTKAEHDWTKPGDVVAPLKYVPTKPKTAIAVYPRHESKRRRILITSVLCTILHFATLALWIALGDSEKKGDDTNSSHEHAQEGGMQNDTLSDAVEEYTNGDTVDREDALFFLFLTLGMMAFCFLLLMAKLLALLRLKLEDYITIHEAIAVTTDNRSPLPIAKQVGDGNTKV